jgi:Mu transposase, C-terminal domain
LNQAITELLDRLNHHRFRKLEGNRAERFATIDRSALRPLPVEPYTFAEWKKVRVNIDYHIEIERHYYSVPYTLLHRELDVRYTAMTVEIFHRGQRIASHAVRRSVATPPTMRIGPSPINVIWNGHRNVSCGGHPPLALLPLFWSIRSFSPVLIPNRDSAVVWGFCVWDGPTARIVWKPHPRGPAISTRVPTKA